MDSTFVTIVLGTATVLWVLLLLVQLVDVVTGRMLRRAGRAYRTRDRDRLLVWTVTFGAIVLVLVIYGVVMAVRLIHDLNAPVPGALLMIGLAAISAATGILAARIMRRPKSGYSVLLKKVQELEGTRVTKGRISDFRNWLESIDKREGDVRRRVLLGRSVRVIPPLTAVIAALAAVILSFRGELSPGVVAVALLACAASVALSIAGARFSLTRNVAVHAVHQKQRTEIVAGLDELERRAPRRATGLTDRVSRALAILREQQNT